MSRFFMITTVYLFIVSCSQEENIATCDDENASASDKGVPCSHPTEEQRALQALNAQDPDTAITIMKTLQQAEEPDYAHWAILAAAYAAKAQVKILNLFRSSLTGQGDVFELLQGFLPNPAERGDAYSQDIDNIVLARTTLEEIPRTLWVEGTTPFTSSIVLQHQLYEAAYPVMLLNRFVVPSTTQPEQIDSTVLESMSDAEAELIFNSLQGAAAEQSGDDPALQSKVADVTNEIEASEGVTTREKLINFVKAKENE